MGDCIFIMVKCKIINSMIIFLAFQAKERTQSLKGEGWIKNARKNALNS